MTTNSTTTRGDPYLGSPDNPKTAGIVCYITIIGWIIAYLLYKGNRNDVSAFHLRQTLLLHILAFVINVLAILSYWGSFPYGLLIVLALLLLVCWLVGLSGAVAGKKRAAPFIGSWSQRMFAGI